MARVFILEDSIPRIVKFTAAFINHTVTIAKTIEEAREKFCPPYDMIFLDHDLEDPDHPNPRPENTGSRFCEEFRDELNASTGLIIIHSLNYDGRQKMLSLIPVALPITYLNLDLVQLASQLTEAQ